MSALPYMPLYVADYLADTAHLTALENGAYLMLIMNYWQRGKALPGKSEQLARIARVSLSEWEAIEPSLVDFFEVVDGQWTHARVNSELAKVHDKSIKASNAGKASAQRKSNERSTPVEQTFSHTDADTDTEVIRLDSAGVVLEKPSVKVDQFDLLEKQMREAAGWEREPHPNLAVIGPVAAILTMGVDLDQDLLPACRTHGPRLTSRTSWKYILHAAISNRDNRLNALKDASNPSQPSNGYTHAPRSKSNSIADSFAAFDAAIADRERELAARENSAGIGNEGIRLVS